MGQTTPVVSPSSKAVPQCLASSLGHSRGWAGLR